MWLVTIFCLVKLKTKNLCIRLNWLLSSLRIDKFLKHLLYSKSLAYLFPKNVLFCALTHHILLNFNFFIFSCWLSHFQGGLGAFPSPSFSSAGNQNLPDYVLNLLGGEGNHFQLRGGNDSSSEVELIPFASQVIPFVRQTFSSTVCIPPRITETLKFPYKLYSH